MSDEKAHGTGKSESCKIPLERLVMQWFVVNELPPAGRKVIAIYHNDSHGKRRTIMAMHLPAFFSECSCEFECSCEYDEKRDCNYYPEGWYEVIENWDEWGFIPVINGEISHWMNLPSDPISEGDHVCMFSVGISGQCLVCGKEA